MRIRAARQPSHNTLLAVLVGAAVPYAVLQTMVIPALPVLVRELHTTTEWVTWLFTGYLLVSAVFTPLYGKLGDQYGKTRMMLIAMAAFFLGSLGAAFAPNIWALIGCRMFQGLGAGVFPLSFSIIKDEFPPERVPVAIGLVSSTVGFGAGFGFLLSGLIIDHLSWRYVFVFGAVGIGFSLVLGLLLLPESSIKSPARIDLKGAGCLSIGLVALLVGLTEAPRWGWVSSRTVALYLVALMLLVAWVIVELHVPEPMVDIRMLTRRSVLLTNITGMLSGYAMLGSFLLIPVFVQTPRGLPHHVAQLVHYGFGASSTKTGLYLLPGSITGVLAGTAAGLLGRRYGAKWALALAVLSGGVGVECLALWHDRPWEIMVSVVVLYCGLPSVFAITAMLIVHVVRPHETGVAAGMSMVFRTIGSVIGGQVGAAILVSKTIPGTAVPTEAAFVTALRISAAVSVLAVVIALFITPLRPSRTLVRSELGAHPDAAA